jgi:hypothetical protein
LAIDICDVEVRCNVISATQKLIPEGAAATKYLVSYSMRLMSDVFNKKRSRR